MSQDGPGSPGGEGEDAAGPGQAGGFAHTPVLLAEVLRFLQPRPGQTVVDATLGGGGHAAALVDALAPGGRLVGIDRDPAAIGAAASRLQGRAAAAAVRLDLVRANYAHLARELDRLGLPLVDGVLFDCGVSSPQLDDPERGFTYRADAALDMRMDPDQTLSAYHLVNGLSEDELAGVIRRYGEERWAARIAAHVVRRRRERGLIATTGELVDVITAAVPAPARRHGPHPARRTFQALRIAVNGELDALDAGLRVAAARLRPGGRVVALSFHSLEDRIVKHVFRELSRGCICPPDWPVCRCGRAATLSALAGHPIQPDVDEVRRNPRARSAKLRAALRLPAAPPAEGDELPIPAGGQAGGSRDAGADAADGAGEDPDGGRAPVGPASIARPLKPLAVATSLSPLRPPARTRAGRPDPGL